MKVVIKGINLKDERRRNYLILTNKIVRLKIRIAMTKYLDNS